MSRAAKPLSPRLREPPLTPDLAEELFEECSTQTRELVIERKTGRVRQAGAEMSEGAWVERQRHKCESNLYYFLRTILNMWWLEPSLHVAVCDWLQRVPPRAKVLMMPRNHGKSCVVAQGLPLHMLIQPRETNVYMPGLAGAAMRILMVGENEDRISDHYRPLKRALEANELLRAFWPAITWQNPHRDAPVWNNTELIVNRGDEYPDPSVRAIGVGGATTGSHPFVLIEDDLTTEKAANEPPTMQRAIEWHRNAEALLEDPERSLRFVTGTRWAVGDLLDTIEQNDPTFEFNSDWQQIVKDGKPIYPSKFGGKGVIETLRARFGPMFHLLYMNSIVASGVTDFDESDLRAYRRIGDQLIFDECDADARLAQEVNAPPPEPKTPDLRGRKLDSSTYALIRLQRMRTA